MKINKVVVLLGAVALVVSGCSSEVSDDASTARAESQAQPQSETATYAAGSSESADATAVAGDLKRAADTATEVVTITEENDPNDLIGRPNGYLSAAVLYDSGVTCDSLGAECGLTVEVYPDDTGARGRAEFIQGTYRDMPILGTEWNYVKGPVLVRITGEMKPSVANTYADRFGGEQVVAPEQ